MKRLRLLNPLRIRDAVRQIRRVSSGGGPARVRLVKLGEPEGWFIPTAELTLEVDSKDGTTHSFTPAMPVPFPYAWAWRISRRLGVPLVSAIDPERISFELPVPGRS